MKKAISCIAILLLVLAVFGGCGKLETPATSITAVSPSPIASQSPENSQSPVISQNPEMPPRPSITATPGPTIEAPNKLSTNIPDVVFDPAEKYEQMNSFYEDSQYVYTRIYNNRALNLVAIAKSTGQVFLIQSRCDTFTYDNGNLYWSGYDDKSKKYILIKYDLLKNEKTPIKTFDMPVGINCVHDGILYILQKRALPANEGIHDLYSMTLDGSSFTEVMKDVNEAAFYKGKMYYGPNMNQSAPIFEYDPSTNTTRKITKTDDSINFSSILNHDTLFHRIPGGIELLNPKTGEVLGEFPKGTYMMAYGQYIIYVIEQGSPQKATLNAYDTTTGKVYALCDFLKLLQQSVDFHIGGTGQNIYLIIGTSTDDILYKLVIEGGKARLEKVTKQ